MCGVRGRDPLGELLDPPRSQTQNDVHVSFHSSSNEVSVVNKKS